MYTIRHLGDAEAHAAGAALAELRSSPSQGYACRYVRGRLVSSYAVGDSINVAFADGHRRCVVLEVLTDTTYHVVHERRDGGREHYAIDVDAIAAF